MDGQLKKIIEMKGNIRKTDLQIRQLGPIDLD